MEKQAIIIVYSGIEPDKETLRAAVEAVANGVHMDTQMMNVTVLNDKEIAQALVAKTLKSYEAVCVENGTTLWDAIQYVVSEMKSDGHTPEREAIVLVNKYMSCVVNGAETELFLAINKLYDCHDKLDLIHRIKNQMGWSLAQTKDLLDVLFSTIQSCRGRFGK